MPVNLKIAYLLVHERLPTVTELAAYTEKLRSLRDLPASVKSFWKRFRATLIQGCDATACCVGHDIAGGGETYDREA